MAAGQSPGNVALSLFVLSGVGLHGMSGVWALILGMDGSSDMYNTPLDRKYI